MLDWLICANIVNYSDKFNMNAVIDSLFEMVMKYTQ